jgi:hypothetical protein
MTAMAPAGDAGKDKLRGEWMLLMIWHGMARHDMACCLALLHVCSTSSPIEQLLEAPLSLR